MRKGIAIICFVFLLKLSAAQNIPIREFRAVWVATVGNIDWPSKQGLPAEIQQQEFKNILDIVHKNNMNAVIVQIRPSADAFFQSPYENWTRYLSGKQGVPPTPYYDPLAFMVEECHKRCIEFHAWFNPYRALVDANKNPNDATHITHKRPDWFVNYGGKKYFNPGIPEVKKYFTDVVLDVVKRYDIDAVHFDDYFYPYRIANVSFPDDDAYRKYNPNQLSKDDWRRENVNTLIASLSKKIKEEKPYVKFGISPFGVWRNYSKDPEGSFTNGGQTNYDDLYADILLWLKKGWIDYVLPQLYWEIGHKAADYNELLRWWGLHCYGKHLYIGHGLYQMGTNTKPCWQGTPEIQRQIDALRKNNNVQGSAFYSTNTLTKNKYNINETCRTQWYPYPAMLPQMNWLPAQKIPIPTLTMQHKNDGYSILKWQIKNDTNMDLMYGVFRFQNASDKNPILVAITREQQYKLNDIDATKYKYKVLALDRLHNASDYSNIAE